MPYFDSTAVLRGEYEEEARQLQLWFPDDPGPYTYYNVPLEVYLELLEAESKGRYFAAHIRDRFEYSPPVVP
jgi:hypothetical protein